MICLIIFSGCANRIRKVPVAPADAQQARVLAHEGDDLLREGKDHFALLKYTEASVLNPYSEAIFNKLAIAYSRLLQFDRAGRSIDRAIRLGPRYAPAYNTKGIIRLAEHRPKEAVSALRRAVQLQPEQPYFRINLGNAYLTWGRYKEGKAEYLKALSLDPKVFELDGVLQISTTYAENDPEKSFQLALLFAELGDAEVALQHLSKALSLGFRDVARINKSVALRNLKSNTEFVALMGAYGINIGPGR